MNKLVKSAFDKIILDDTTKSRILNNVINKKKKFVARNYIVLGTTSALAFILFFSPIMINDQPKNIQSKNRPAPIRMTNTFYYKEQCYEEIGLYKGTQQDLELISENHDFGGSFYKIKNSKNVVIFIGDYVEYKLCRGETRWTKQWKLCFQ